MDGILLINKEKGMTSRDVVNQISRKLHIKKVGHAGTLDPIATGLLVIGVGKGTKILDLLTMDTKEYIATVQMGIQTDTMDVTGEVIEKQEDKEASLKEINKVLESFLGSYEQVVPKYSAVKVNGKKLYEYARNKEEVELPKRLIEVIEISLLDYNKEKKEFTFKALVSKGTYIRSLINDIGKSLHIPCTMKDLVRTKSGKFSLSSSLKVDENLEKILPIKEALDFPIIKVEGELLKRVRNGAIIDLENQNFAYVTIVDSLNQEVAIYKRIDFSHYKAFKVF